jgi:hypothetical protein
MQFIERVMYIRHRFAINNQKDLQTVNNTKSRKSSTYLKYPLALNCVRIFVISLCYMYVLYVYTEVYVLYLYTEVYVLYVYTEVYVLYVYTEVYVLYVYTEVYVLYVCTEVYVLYVYTEVEVLQNGGISCSHCQTVICVYVVIKWKIILIGC